MHKLSSVLLFLLMVTSGSSQILTDSKGTRFIIDSSKWELQGNDLFNKNSGNVGIGTDNPLAQLHTTGTVRLEGININSNNTKIITTDNMGNIAWRHFSNMLIGKSMISLNGLTNSYQIMESGDQGNDFQIVSDGVSHIFNIPTSSSVNRGLLSSSDWTLFNSKEEALTFSEAFNRENNVVSLKSNLNIQAISNLTENGILKTTGNNGTLAIATAGDFPTLNQNTTGSAATLTTSRLIYGNSFNGSSDVTAVIASQFGGTGFSNYSNGQLLIGNAETNTLSKSTVTAGAGIKITNAPGSITISSESTIQQVTGTNQLSTNSNSDESLSTPMSITPGSGDFMVMFNAVVSNTQAGKGVIMSIYLNNSKIESTEMQATSGKDNDKNTISCFTYVTDVQAGQSIEVKWRAESHSAKVTNRNLIVQKVK
jgi:hypothetical protein